MFKYKNNIVSDVDIDSTFVVLISNPNESKEDLLNELKDKLLFPDYFGGNWDALYDCLCDLSWISKPSISLRHRHLPQLDDDNMKIYLNILIDTLCTWKTESEKKI